MNQENQKPPTLTREVAPSCGWCGLEPAVTKHLATDTCRTCLAGGSAHRVLVSLQRWAQGAKKS